MLGKLLLRERQNFFKIKKLINFSIKQHRLTNISLKLIGKTKNTQKLSESRKAIIRRKERELVLGGIRNQIEGRRQREGAVYMHACTGRAEQPSFQMGVGFVDGWAPKSRRRWRWRRGCL